MCRLAIVLTVYSVEPIANADSIEKLYGVKADPNEWTNLASEAKHGETKRDLERWLPRIDRPPAPGSTHRLLTYDAKAGAVT